MSSLPFVPFDPHEYDTAQGGRFAECLWQNLQINHNNHDEVDFNLKNH